MGEKWIQNSWRELFIKLKHGFKGAVNKYENNFQYYSYSELLITFFNSEKMTSLLIKEIFITDVYYLFLSYNTSGYRSPPP